MARPKRKLQRSQPSKHRTVIVVEHHVGRHSLAGEIEEFLTETGMTPTTFGTQVMRDPNFVFDMRNGREPTPAIATMLLAQMAFHRQWQRFAHPARALAALQQLDSVTAAGGYGDGRNRRRPSATGEQRP
jgi:hypothetical protein